MYSNKKQQRYHYADSTLTLSSLCSHVHHPIHQDFLLLPVYSMIFFLEYQAFYNAQICTRQEPSINLC